jgi:outer membrane protein W
MVFDTKDSGISSLKADNVFGGVLWLGLDHMVDDSNGFFFSANKVFVNTKAKGNAVALGGLPVEAKIDLDPRIRKAGWVHRL